RRHRSHDVLALADCPIAVPGLLTRAVGPSSPAGAETDAVRDVRGTQHVARLDPVLGSRRRRTHWVHGGTAVQQAADRTWRLRGDGVWQGHPAAAETFAAVVGGWGVGR